MGFFICYSHSHFERLGRENTNHKGVMRSSLLSLPLQIPFAFRDVLIVSLK